MKLNNIIVVDKTYLPVRRKLHDSNYSKNGIKPFYSKGTVKSIQKGRKVGYKGIEYILSGIERGKYRLTQIIERNKRNTVKSIDYISNQYTII